MKILTPSVATLDPKDEIFAQLNQENANLNTKIDLLTVTIKNMQIEQTKFIDLFNQNKTNKVETMDQSEESVSPCSLSHLDGIKATSSKAFKNDLNFLRGENLPPSKKTLTKKFLISPIPIPSFSDQLRGTGAPSLTQ